MAAFHLCQQNLSNSPSPPSALRTYAIGLKIPSLLSYHLASFFHHQVVTKGPHVGSAKCSDADEDRAGFLCSLRYYQWT